MFLIQKGGIMQVTEKHMAIGRKIAYWDDPELRAFLMEELLEKARPLLGSMMIWASVYAGKISEDFYEYKEAERRFENAFLYLVGSFWAAMGSFPWVLSDRVRASRYSGKPNWIIMEALNIHAPLDFTWEVDRILGGGPETGFATRKLLELLDAVLDSIHDECIINNASEEDVVEAAERILRSA